MNKKIFFLQKLNKYDVLTIVMFSIGMLLSIIDKNILNGLTNVLSGLTQITFVLTYLILVIFMFFTIKLFIKSVPNLRLIKKEGVIKTFFICFKLFMVGYYIGFLISLTNAFIIVTFNQTANLL